MILKPDYSADANMTKSGYETVVDRYLRGNETSPQEAFARCASAFATNLAHAERMYSYFQKQWYGASSPSLSNAPVRIKFEEDFEKNFSAECFESVEGPQPIACFTGYVPDSRIGIADHYQEILWYLSNGGGYQASWSALRPAGSLTSLGNKTGGTVSFFHGTDSLVPATHQGSNRRGVYGGELHCSHVEVVEFAESRKKSGNMNRRSLNVFQTISITDAFMLAVLANDDWNLLDHLGNVVTTHKARYLWELFLEAAGETGGPFLHFIDASNRHLPEVQKKLGLKVNNVNICTEITLANNAERTAVCCLGSVNIYKCDEWQNDSQFIPDVVEFLDNILEYFIQNMLYSCTRDFNWPALNTFIEKHLPSIDKKTKSTLSKAFVNEFIQGGRKAVFSAKKERAIGLGAMGLGSYFSKNNIVYGSRESYAFTDSFFKDLKAKAVAASKALALVRGEPDDMFGTGMRNSHLLSIAPTATNSIIAASRMYGEEYTSLTAALEPRYENAYSHKTQSGRHFMLEPEVVRILKERNAYNDEMIESIVGNLGSVQHLDCFTEHEKELLLTAREIDQRKVVEIAAIAQQYVCQAIAINLDFPANAPRKYVNAVHIYMWKRGCKSRYYLRFPSSGNSNVFRKNVANTAITIDYDADDLFTGCMGCQ